MRILWLIVVTVMIGLAAGLGSTLLQLRLSRWDRNPGGAADASLVPEMSDLDEYLPEFSVDKTVHDFGTMDHRSQGRHNFVVTNTGQGTLRLTIGGSSCGCTIAKLDRKTIPPGESVNVEMTWRPKGDIGPYSENAKVRTNDPKHRGVTLTVKGRVTAAVRVVPAVLIFSRTSAGESATGETAVYGYLDDPLEILEATLTNLETAEKFDVSYEPLSPEEIEEEPRARSGYRVRVTTKPGLPLGAFEQTIRFTTNLQGAEHVDLLVVGMVGKEITVVGRGWSESNALLMLGAVDSRKTTRRRLWLIARGPGHEQVQFKPVDVFPDLLKVSIGQSAQVGEGKATRTELFIEIPKGSRRANHLGSQQGEVGRIKIQTTDPKVPEIQLRVRFAVEG